MSSKQKTTIVIIAAAAVVAAGALWYSLSGTPEILAMAPDNAEVVKLGKTLYTKECASCHGAKLEGQPNWRQRLPDGGLPAPPHDQTGHTWHHPDQLLFRITKNGGTNRPGFQSNMPGFGDRYSDGEIWAVLSYIKSRWPQPVRRRHDSINARAR